MIAYLQGILHEIGSDHIILLAGGVGYQVFVTKSSVNTLPAIGTFMEWNIHTVVREDSFSLYGFKKSAEKELFLKILQVSNIGPKLALTIMSGLPMEDLVDAIRKEDLVRLTAISGIGKKTAERLIVELKDKLLPLLGTGPEFTREEKVHLPPTSLREEAISALMNLGYSRQEAQQAIKNVTSSKDLSLEVLVREGLKALS